jgi:hypothetical protein
MPEVTTELPGDLYDRLRSGDLNVPSAGPMEGYGAQ